MNKDYEVGYGKPPKHSRFKKGRSGNPRGRSKGTKNLKTDLAEELAERIQVTENGRVVALTKQRVMVKALTAKAMKGDTKAASTLIGLVAQTVGLDPQEEQDVDLSAKDNAILAEWLTRSGPAENSGAKSEIDVQHDEDADANMVSEEDD